MSSESDYEMKEEYNPEDLVNGVRGKYFERYQRHSNIVKLDDDVAKAFPNAQAVNEALRKLIRND